MNLYSFENWISANRAWLCNTKKFSLRTSQKFGSYLFQCCQMVDAEFADNPREKFRKKICLNRWNLKWIHTLYLQGQQRDWNQSSKFEIEICDNPESYLFLYRSISIDSRLGILFLLLLFGTARFWENEWGQSRSADQSTTFITARSQTKIGNIRDAKKSNLDT